MAASCHVARVLPIILGWPSMAFELVEIFGTDPGLFGNALCVI